MKKQFLSTIAGVSILIAAIGFVSKGIGFLREILFASIYGLSTGFDIYLVGAVLPLTINTIILSLGQNYLIPAYNKIKEKDVDQALIFIQSNFYLFTFIGTIFAFFLYFLSGHIISMYLTNSNSSLNVTAQNIFNLFLISIPLTCGISVIIAYLQSNLEFKYSVTSQILPNIVVLVTVYFFRSIDIYAIPIGFIIGTILQIIFLLIKSKKIFFNERNITFSIIEYKKFGSITLVFILLIETFGQLYIILDRYFYNSVSNGGISALNYAQTIFALPLSIISIALSTAIFPKFSQLLHKNLLAELEKYFNEAIKVNIVFFTPIMFLFIFYGDIIFKIIFERGNFSSSDTFITNKVLFYYSLSIIFYAAYGIFNKLIYSAGLIKKLLFITIIGIILKIAFNFLFVKDLQQNGLALSTSISYLFFFGSTYFVLTIKLKFKNKYAFFKDLVFYISAGILAISVAKLLIGDEQDSSYSQLLQLLIYIVIYFTTLILLKTESINNFLKTFSNIVGIVK